MQFQSDISEAGIKIPDAEELSVIGASYLAGISAGVYDENEIYQSISYQRFTPGMEAKMREEKKDGWKTAVEMLLK